MSPLWKKVLYLLCCSAILLAVGFANAQSGGCPPQATGTIQNPIRSCTFLQFVQSIASSVVFIATPIAIVAIIFIGLKLVTASASGNQSEMQKAKQNLTYVLIGTVIVVGASALAYAAVNFAITL